MKKILLVLTTLFFISLPIVAQTPDFQMVKTEDGMIVVNNNKSQRFSFLVAGKNPNGEASDDGSLLVVTDSPTLAEAMLIFCVKKSDFPEPKKLTDELVMLSVYRQLNVLKLEQIYQAKVNIDFEGKSFVKIMNLTNNLFPTKMIPTFYWSYVAPMPRNTDRSLFQTVVIDDRILVISTVFPESTKLEQVTTFFKQTLESIALLPPQKQAVTPTKKPVKKKAKKN
jgi:hypothetical protein